MISTSKYHFTKEQITDEFELIKAAIKDPSKFEVLYKRYHEQIFRFIYQKLDDKELAFDLTSQVFLKAMMNLPKYQFKGVPFASWLYRIATNELYQAFNRNASLRTVNIENAGLQEIVEEADEDFLEEYKPQLIEAIKTLPEEDMQIVEMRFFQQMAFKQIAEILDITESNAKMKLYRILEKLKKRILKPLNEK